MRRVLDSGVSAFGVCARSRCAWFCLSVALAAAPAWAQTYNSKEPTIDDKAAKAMQPKVGSALRNPAGFGADEPVVQDYFMKHYFPSMTLYTPENLAQLGKKREDLFRRFIRVTPSAESQAKLTDWALKVTTALTRGNYHPAVRYNAALILGELDEKIAVAGAAPAPPVPLPAATAAMLDLLEQSDFAGVPVHPSVKLGALVGLERHAQYGVSPQHAEQVTQAALDVIAQEKPVEDVSKDVHQWMKCRAASVLVWQNQKKPDAPTMKALNALMSDEAFDLDNRAYVASLLKRLDFKQAADLDSAAAATAVGNFSHAVLKTESDLAHKYQDEKLGTGEVDFRSFRRGGYGEEESGPKYERRRLITRLNAIVDAATALKANLPQLQGLLNAIEPARQVAANKDKSELDIVEQVIDSAKKADQVMQGWNADGAAAQAAQADFSTVTAR